MEEIWKPVPFAPAYQASSFGRIIGIRGTLLYPTPNHAGYLVCDLHKKQYRVNRIICHTFHGAPPSPEHHAAHKDSDRLNNQEDNLYWVTPLENGNDLSLTNNLKGDSTSVAKLSTDEVIGMRTMYDFGIHIAAVGRMYPLVCQSTVSHAILRRTWTHI